MWGWEAPRLHKSMDSEELSAKDLVCGSSKREKNSESHLGPNERKNKCCSIPWTSWKVYQPTKIVNSGPKLNHQLRQATHTTCKAPFLLAVETFPALSIVWQHLPQGQSNQPANAWVWVFLGWFLPTFKKMMLAQKCVLMFVVPVVLFLWHNTHYIHCGTFRPVSGDFAKTSTWRYCAKCKCKAQNVPWQHALLRSVREFATQFLCSLTRTDPNRTQLRAPLLFFGYESMKQDLETQYTGALTWRIRPQAVSSTNEWELCHVRGARTKKQCTVHSVHEMFAKAQLEMGPSAKTPFWPRKDPKTKKRKHPKILKVIMRREQEMTRYKVETYSVAVSYECSIASYGIEGRHEPFQEYVLLEIIINQSTWKRSASFQLP